MILLVGACTGRRGADLKPPAGFAAPPPGGPKMVPLRAHRIEFREGFFPPEQDGSGKIWRWMGRRGVIELPRAPDRAMTLRLAGWVPLELFPASARVRLTLDQRELDSFVPTSRDVDRTYTILQGPTRGAARPVLVLEVSQTGRAPNDARDLGLAISSVDWQSASPAAP
jgi:hypothetical protein